MDKAETPTAEHVKLDKAYKHAVSTVAKQNEQLVQLLTEPMIFGTVVNVHEFTPSREDYAINDLVLVTDPASPFCNCAGRVQELPAEDGRVGVLMMGDGGTVRFAIGLEGGEPAQVRLLGKGDAGRTVVQTRCETFEVESVPALRLVPGDVVKLVPKTNQIVGRAGFTPPGGVCRVKSVLECGQFEVEMKGESRVVYPGYFRDQLAVGDRVCLDLGNLVVTQKLPPDFSDQYGLHDEIRVTWDHIGGCEEAKEELIEALEFPHKFPDLYAHYRKEPIRGALLYGPPGCGKSMIAAAAAHSLATTHNKAAIRSGFIYVKGPELLKKYVGESEATLVSLFVKAEAHYAKHGYPALMFIDEADALLRKRGSGISSDITDNMVDTFLSEMSGLKASHCMVLLATNVPKMLDSAVLRDGRCDRHIKVPRPTISVLPDLFDLYFRPDAGPVPLAEGFGSEEAVALATAEVTSQRFVIYHVSSGEARMPFMLEDAVSGAMVKGIVAKAASLAMKRDMREGTLTGIGRKDLRRAVVMTYRMNRDLNHDLDLIDFAERKGIDPQRLKVAPAPPPDGIDF